MDPNQIPPAMYQAPANDVQARRLVAFWLGVASTVAPTDTARAYLAARSANAERAAGLYDTFSIVAAVTGAGTGTGNVAEILERGAADAEGYGVHSVAEVLRRLANPREVREQHEAAGGTSSLLQTFVPGYGLDKKQQKRRNALIIGGMSVATLIALLVVARPYVEMGRRGRGR